MSEKKLLCPMQFNRDSGYGRTCYKGECAWWIEWNQRISEEGFASKKVGHCAIKDIAGSVEHLGLDNQ